MSSLWWLESGWGNARCEVCGCNIKSAGGDPDHGVCPEHFDAMYPQPEPHMPQCDICGQGVAVGAVNGYGVCSEACAHQAETRES